MASPDPDAPIDLRAEWDAALESQFYERLAYSLKAVVPEYPRGHAQLLYVRQIPKDGA
jgi:hypothetical protein